MSSSNLRKLLLNVRSASVSSNNRYNRSQGKGGRAAAHSWTVEETASYAGQNNGPSTIHLHSRHYATSPQMNVSNNPMEFSAASAPAVRKAAESVHHNHLDRYAVVSMSILLCFACV